MSVRVIIGDVREQLRLLPDESVHCVDRLEEWQLAYLAGLIDGEGSIESQRERQPRGATPRFVLRLSFVFATREPLQTVSTWLGSRVSEHPSVDDRRSPRFRSHIYKDTAVRVLSRCLPYLILKKRQAELILAIESVRKQHSPSRRHFGSQAGTRMPAAAIDEMLSLHQELRSLKSNKRRMA